MFDIYIYTDMARHFIFIHVCVTYTACLEAKRFFFFVTITLSFANRCIGVWEQLSVPQGVAFRSDLSHGRLLDGNLNSTVTSAKNFSVARNSSVFLSWFQDASSRFKSGFIAVLVVVEW